MSAPALYSVAEIRRVERAAQAELPAGALMQRAGEACARHASVLAAGAERTYILILAGPGNNGGDALEAAHCLAQAGLRVAVALYADESAQPEEARRALRRARAGAVEFLDITDPGHLTSQRWTLVIDGLLGIGQTRPLAGGMRASVDHVNTLCCPVLSIDVASGLDADTGSIAGGSAIRATHTLSFIGDKPGLHTCDGPDFSGRITIESLGIDDRHFPVPRARLNGATLFGPVLKPRAGNTHKGSYGDVIVVGGAHGMGGAPVLAARMAAYAGSGRVFIAFLDEAPAYDSLCPELMIRQAGHIEFGAATVVAGPGLGVSHHARDVLARILNTPGRIVVDADALNLIAAAPDLQHSLQHRPPHTSIITPHPLEAARLLGISAAGVQHDRPQAARLLARRFEVITILKGAGTIIALPDGEIVINTTGNPALSTAGAGDVLSGLCGALLAQGQPAMQAAWAAVWLHGRAADRLVDLGIGPVGLSASEIIPAIRALINQMSRAVYR